MCTRDVHSPLHSSKLLRPLHISVGILQPSFTGAWQVEPQHLQEKVRKKLREWSKWSTCESFQKKSSFSIIPSLRSRWPPFIKFIFQVCRNAWLALMLGFSSALWWARHLQPLWQRNPIATAARLGRRTQLILRHLVVSTSALAVLRRFRRKPQRDMMFWAILHIFFWEQMFVILHILYTSQKSGQIIDKSKNNMLHSLLQFAVFFTVLP